MMKTENVERWKFEHTNTIIIHFDFTPVDFQTNLSKRTQPLVLRKCYISMKAVRYRIAS